jgi:hypothetical protein
MMNSDRLNQAIQLIRAGNKQAALPILSEIVQIESNNESAWLWLFVCVDSVSQKEYCLQKALEINPYNQNTRNEIEKLSNTKPISSASDPLISPAHSQLPNQDHRGAEKAFDNELLVRKFKYYLSIIAVVSTLILMGSVVYSIDRNRRIIRSMETTQTQASVIETTQMQKDMIAAAQTESSIVNVTQTQLSIVAATQMNMSVMQRIVDEYLTAIENGNWLGAYNYLCSEIQAKIRSPKEMSKRILAENSDPWVASHPLPDSHTILHPRYNLPYRVLFTLAGPTWSTGTYEARLKENSLRICGVGKEQGDLRYLLFPGTTPLDINP